MMTTTYDLEIKVMAWYKHNDVVELDRLVGSWPSSLYNWISKVYKQTMRKLCTDSYQLKNIAYYYKNEWPHTHGQYNSRVNECYM